jgi:hypothetical protein
MQRYRLFAAGAAVALLLGGASPAMAKVNNPKAKGHVNKPAKTTPPPKAKKSKAGVSGGGAIGANEFSIQARQVRLAKGHFNFTDPEHTYKLRCRGFEPDSLTITASSAHLVTSKCETTRADGVRRPATLDATFVDNGQPAESEVPTPGPDTINFTATDAISAVTWTGPVNGNIKVRP